MTGADDGYAKWRAFYDWSCLHAAAAGREDWDAVALLGVMTACRQAEVPYEEFITVLWRLARDGDHQEFAELRALVRARPSQGAAGSLQPDLKARAIADAEAATERFRQQAARGTDAA